MKLGIICPSEIAYRRFLPALKSCGAFEFAGVSVNTPEERFGSRLPDRDTVEAMLAAEREKAEAMTRDFGGTVMSGYRGILENGEIGAMYLPLPPALHYRWARMALEQGKHVLVEKPATISAEDTRNLVGLAREKGLALHENYMFVFHNQMEAVREIIISGAIGEPRLYRIRFGFPRRAANDFRYNRALGGGALLDAGGYTLKCAAYYLGDSARVTTAQMNYTDEFEVDLFGSATMVNAEGSTAQVAFGMDNDYKCELEVWGSRGSLLTGRILTAPAGFVPSVTIRTGAGEETRELPADDAFRKSIEHFSKCIADPEEREKNYQVIIRQAELVETFKSLAGEENSHV